MSVLLAIEPDRRQAARLTALARGPLLAEIVIGETAESAFAALGARVPDLVLTSLLLSPKDESALADRLRELDAAGRHVQTLVIPVLGGSSETEGKRSKGFFGRLMKSSAKTTTDGCDPAVFGDQIREYLERGAADRAAKAAAQADLDAAWSEQPPAVPAATESFPLPAESSYHALAEDEASTPWAFSAPPTEQTAADIVHRESISIETETAVLASEPSSVEPDFTEQLRAQLSPVVEPDAAIRSQPDMLDPEPQVEAPVIAALDSDIDVALPEPEYRFEAQEPEVVIAAWEPQSSVQPVVDPVGEAAASESVFDVAAAPAKPHVQDEEWEEISLEAAGDHDAPSEIVSETIDIEALMRELRAVESDGASDDLGPSSHAMSFPPSAEAAAAELSANFDAVAPPAPPPVAPSDAAPPRPSLDLEAFAAALKLAATPVVPEPPPEPPPVPRSSPFQSGWRDVLSAIRRDIDQLQEEKPTPAPTPRSARDRAFEPLVFPARPAPAAEALSRIEPPVPTRVEPPPPAPTEVPVLAQLEEAVRSLIKPLAKKPREAAPAPPAAEIVVPSPAMPVLAATVAPPAIEITPAPDLAPVAVAPPVAAPPAVKQTVAAPPAVEIVVPSPAIPVLAAAVATPAIEITPAPDLAPVIVAPPVVAPPAVKPTVAAPPAVEIVVPSPAMPVLAAAVATPAIEITPPPALAPVVVASPVVSVPVVSVAPPELDVAPVFDPPAPKPLPSPVELLSSLGLEPVDVLVPDPVPIVEPEPIIEQPDELSSASTDRHDHDAVLVEPTSRRSSKSKKKRRIEQTKPTAKTPHLDDWGFFDPQKVGFATLLSKLDEIADR